MKRVAIVGGGISGLVCAHVLTKNNVDVRLYEMNSTLGGRIKEYPVGDSYLALGAKTISPNYTNFISLIGEMGLSERIVKSDERIGIFSRHRLIRLRPTSILLDRTISLNTKLDLLRLKRYLDSLDPGSIGDELMKTSLREFVLQRYSEGVLDDFVDPFVRAFFADASSNISASSGLQIISGAFLTHELQGGYYPLVQAMESRLGERVVKGAKVEEVEVRPNGRFSVKLTGRDEEADVVVCCVPVPELRKIVDGISYPDVSYVSKMAYAVQGESRYPEVGEIINGDPEYRVDVIHFRGNLATLSSIREDPDLTTFFRSARILTVHRWPYCSPRAKPGASPPRFETEIPNLYKSGDLIYGGGLESSSRAGIEVANLVVRGMTGN